MSLTLKSKATTSARSITGSSMIETIGLCVPYRKWRIRSCLVRGRPGQLGKRNYPDGYRIELIDGSGR